MALGPQTFRASRGGQGLRGAWALEGRPPPPLAPCLPAPPPQPLPKLHFLPRLWGSEALASSARPGLEGLRASRGQGLWARGLLGPRLLHRSNELPSNVPMSLSQACFTILRVPRSTFTLELGANAWSGCWPKFPRIPAVCITSPVLPRGPHALRSNSVALLFANGAPRICDLASRNSQF